MERGNPSGQTNETVLSILSKPPITGLSAWDLPITGLATWDNKKLNILNHPLRAFWPGIVPLRVFRPGTIALKLTVTGLSGLLTEKFLHYTRVSI